MSSGKKKICSVLANLKLVHGKEEVDKKEVCKLAGIPVATAPSLLCRMTKEGLIMKGKTTGYIAVTDKGLKIADPGDMPTSNEEFHEQIKKELKGKARQIFEILLDRKVHKKEDIMKAINCTNKATFDPLLSRAFAKNKYVIYPSKGTVQLSDKCFPFDNM